MKNLLFLSITSLLLCSNTSANIELDPKWTKLIRYQKSIFGTYKSEVDSKEYFLHSDGKSDPKKELEATLNYFKKDKRNICDFPGRAIVLKELGVLKSDETSHCKVFEAFKEKVNLHSVSLIFSSYFIQRPASAFGHTFFRLRSKTSAEKENDLLDYGVDFSAQVTTNNPIAYGVLGIVGGFDGRFKLMPYYYKIREYNDMESRDLWDYELNLNERDKRLFVAHLFEMNRVSFDYYYFSENCSYHILSFVEAIRPDWSLMDELDWFVPPVQTVYALCNKDNIVSNVKFRPSSYKKMLSRIDSLSNNEKKVFKEAVETNSLDSIKKIVSERESLNVLDSLIDYYDFKLSKDLLGAKNEAYKKASKKKFQVNLARSKNSLKSAPLDFSLEYENAPHLGHDTKKLMLGYLNQNKSSGFELEYRFALHNFLDRQVGFIPFSKTEMGNTVIRYTDDSSLRLDRFTVVEIDALRPVTEIENAMSWRFAMGVRDHRPTKKQEYAIYADLSLGGAITTGDFLFSAFVRTETSYADEFSKDLRFGVGPELLLAYNNNKFAFSFEFNRLFLPTQDSKYFSTIKANGRYNFKKNYGVFVKFEDLSFMKEAYSLGVVGHF